MDRKFNLHLNTAHTACHNNPYITEAVICKPWQKAVGLVGNRISLYRYNDIA
ncbi:hypothetical protein HY612_03050 [Candidatus Roizmanbacteria bacterium]|nr:hypothetical protein [Candidatus Roizmanbacteria bacterium]